MNKLRMLSLCAGIGGADLAAEATGWIEIVGQVEIDPFCRSVLAKHWPDVKRMEDINMELLTIREVARELRVTPLTVRIWISTGAMPGVVLPGRGIKKQYRVRRETLESIVK